MKLSDLNTDALVGTYVVLRDRRAARKKAFELDDADDKVKQDKIEAILAKQIAEGGANSINTPHGTAYKHTTTSATVVDWNAFFNYFVVPNQAWEFLEHRANKSSVDAYRNKHQAIPPGLNYSSHVSIKVRRS